MRFKSSRETTHIHRCMHLLNRIESQLHHPRRSQKKAPTMAGACIHTYLSGLTFLIDEPLLRQSGHVSGAITIAGKSLVGLLHAGQVLLQ